MSHAMKFITPIAIATAALALAGPSRAVAGPQELVLEPIRDATLVESPDGLLANGAGQHCFAGATGQPAPIRDRRTVLAFDLGKIPAGSVIESATLTLHCSKAASPAFRTVTMHRLTRAWTEGPSEPIAGEGVGALAEPGDCTWTEASFEVEAWTTPGGDFEPAVRASRTVSGTGFYSWASSGLAEDVNAWLADPATNHGWILIGDESVSTTAKRFDTREVSGSPTLRPRLRVTFSAAPPCPADIDGNGAVDFEDLLAVLSGFGPCPPGDCPADVDGDEAVTFQDLLTVIAAFGDC